MTTLIKTAAFARLALATACLGLSAAGACAQTAAADAWVRGTVAQQKATGAFVTLTSSAGGRLVAVASPAAAVVEIHEMSMDGSVMRMRAVDGVDLPAGKAVTLKPGGFHIMLVDLKQPLKAGDMVPLTLTVQGPDGKRENLQVQAQVRALGGMAGGHGEHKH